MGRGGGGGEEQGGRWGGGASREAETKALSDKISRLEVALLQATSHGSAPAASAAVSGLQFVCVWRGWW